MKNSETDVSVIVVSFNTRDLLDVCLRTLMKQNLGEYRMEVIVVDNGSSDGSPEMVEKKYPGVTLHGLPDNRGFAAANNIGIRASAGRYILLLNSDTEVPPEGVAAMLSFMERTPADIATPKLMLPDGRMDPACHRGFPTPWAGFTYYAGFERLFPKSRMFGQYHLKYLGEKTVHEIDCPSGAFFMVARRVIDEVGLLDEDFFMYAEDIDWAYRMKKAGFRVYFNPSVTVLHRKKQSGRAHASGARRTNTEIMFHQNNLRFYMKHYASVYPHWVSQLVKFYYGIRLFILNHR